MIRRLSRKLGEPCRRGIDGDRDALDWELLDDDRDDRDETLLDDRDELEKLLRLLLVLMEDRELLEPDRERLLDFFDGVRLLDRNFAGDREFDFFDREIDLDLDRDDDLDLDLDFDRLTNFSDSRDLERLSLGDLDFLSLDNDRILPSLEPPECERFDLFSGDNDLV